MNIVFYDSIDDLPIKRFQKFNKMMLISSDIGSDFSDFSKRISAIQEYVKNDLNDKANRELVNFRQSIFNAMEENAPSNYALALMVKSINGARVMSMSDAALDSVLDKLDKYGYSQKQKTEKLSELKKKLILNLKRTSLSISIAIFKLSAGTLLFFRGLTHSWIALSTRVKMRIKKWTKRR